MLFNYFMLDKKDKIILFELFQNSRLSNKQLSKITKIPEKTISNRINKMINEGIITKFTTMINYQLLSMNRHSIYFDLKNTYDDEINKKINEILKIKKISCCYVLHEISQWKLYVSVWTKTIEEYDKIQTKVLKILKDHVTNYISFQSVRSYTYLTRLLNKDKIAKCDIKDKTKNIIIDETDKRIIHLLKENSRMHILDMSKKINVHHDTIKRRMKKLQKEGIIQRFYPLVEFPKIGIREYTFICRINPAEEEKIEKFIKWARGNPHFVIIIKAVGYVNLYYAFQTEKDEQYKKIRKEIHKHIGDATIMEYRIEVEKILH